MLTKNSIPVWIVVDIAEEKMVKEQMTSIQMISSSMSTLKHAPSATTKIGTDVYHQAHRPRIPRAAMTRKTSIRADGPDGADPIKGHEVVLA